MLGQAREKAAIERAEREKDSEKRQQDHMDRDKESASANFGGSANVSRSATARLEVENSPEQMRFELYLDLEGVRLDAYL